MTVGYMQPTMYYVQQQHPQKPRRAKPLPQIPGSIEPTFPQSVVPYYGSISNFPSQPRPPSAGHPISNGIIFLNKQKKKVYLYIFCESS